MLFFGGGFNKICVNKKAVKYRLTAFSFSFEKVLLLE